MKIVKYTNELSISTSISKIFSNHIFVGFETKHLHCSFINQKRACVGREFLENPRPAITSHSICGYKILVGHNKFHIGGHWGKCIARNHARTHCINNLPVGILEERPTFWM